MDKNGTKNPSLATESRQCQEPEAAAIARAETADEIRGESRGPAQPAGLGGVWGGAKHPPQQLSAKCKMQSSKFNSPQWYEKSFGSDYLTLYSHRDEKEAVKDISNIVNLLALQPNMRILDLACGTGRHLSVLKNLGFGHLTGLDLSSALLEVAKSNINASVELVYADMRRIPYADHFDVILSLFTSFGYFWRDAENIEVLAGVIKALNDGGIFLIDYVNRDYVIDTLVPYDEKVIDDLRVVNERVIVGDRVEKKSTVTDPQDNVKTFEESVRLYSLDDMERMLRSVGFGTVKNYGNLDGDSFDKRKSKRLIMVAEK